MKTKRNIFTKFSIREDSNNAGVCFYIGNKLSEWKDLALTWEDIKRIVEIADNLAEYAEAGIIEPFLKSEQSYYHEVLKRYNDTKQ